MEKAIECTKKHVSEPCSELNDGLPGGTYSPSRKQGSLRGKAMLQLDHVAVAAQSLSVARDHVETALGVPLQAGGVHDVFATHNALLGLGDGLYLEAIAANPEAGTPDRPRWFDLDRFEGPPRLTNWICRTDDIEAAVEMFPEAGEPVALSRGDLRWRMAVPPSGILPFDNLFPALIQWDVAETPADRLTQQGAHLQDLVVSHPWASALEALLRPVLTDARVQFQTGPAALKARFMTADGLRDL